MGSRFSFWLAFACWLSVSAQAQSTDGERLPVSRRATATASADPSDSAVTLSGFVQDLPAQVRAEPFLAALHAAATARSTPIASVATAHAAPTLTELGRVTVLATWRGSYGQTKAILADLAQKYQGRLLVRRLTMRKAGDQAALPMVASPPTGAGQAMLDVQVDWVLVSRPLGVP